MVLCISSLRHPIMCSVCSVRGVQAFSDHKCTFSMTNFTQINAVNVTSEVEGNIIK